MKQMIFTREMAEEIAGEFYNYDHEETAYEVDVPGGVIFVDVTSREQRTDGRWKEGATVTFDNAIYYADDDPEGNGVPIDIEQEEVEFDYYENDDWYPGKWHPWG